MMNEIKNEASLDSLSKTTILLVPKVFDFGKLKTTDNLKSFFFVKNTGKIDFNIKAITANCDCVTTKYRKTEFIHPGDSLKIEYNMNFRGQVGQITNSIIAIGNCQFGNQTYIFKGIII